VIMKTNLSQDSPCTCQFLTGQFPNKLVVTELQFTLADSDALQVLMKDAGTCVKQ
jgi:hypothetical protein